MNKRRGLFSTTAYYREGNTGAGGAQAAPGATGGVPGAQGGGAQEPPKPKTNEEKMAEFASLWEPPKPPEPKPGVTPSPSPSPTPGNSDRLQEYFAEQDYFGEMDKAAFGTALREGNVDAIFVEMKKAFTNMHGKALANMQKFSDSAVEKASAKAVSEFTSSYKMDKVFDDMFSQKAELKLPAVAPMAKATVKQFINKGETPENAVKKTIEFFETFGASFGKEPPNNNGGRPNGSSFGSDPSIGSKTVNGVSEKMDYDALWSA